jgi:hypothetical protein
VSLQAGLDTVPDKLFCEPVVQRKCRLNRYRPGRAVRLGADSWPACRHMIMWGWGLVIGPGMSHSETHFASSAGGSEGLSAGLSCHFRLSK